MELVGGFISNQVAGIVAGVGDRAGLGEVVQFVSDCIVDVVEEVAVALVGGCQAVERVAPR